MCSGLNCTGSGMKRYRTVACAGVAAAVAPAAGAWVAG